MLRLTAPWLLPMDGPPIPNGAVLIGGDGRVVAVGPADAVPTPDPAGVEHFAGAVLLPGLVNVHTHLELTGMAGLLCETEFPAWIRRLRAAKTERTGVAFRDSARQGVRD